MTPTEDLMPDLGLLRQEYVLVQAWKKTSAYIRYHNWFSDTLDLDRTAATLPQFLSKLSRDFDDAGNWQSDTLRLVQAPKNQTWHIDGGLWKPREDFSARRMRPLAHVSLRDQVAAAAVMLCLADRVETAQGTTEEVDSGIEHRRRVLSYGNRLFCDYNPTTGRLSHRWGSVKLYRAYHEDYQHFVARPEIVAQSLGEEEHKRLVVVQTDLAQFYDRVRPAMLLDRVGALTEADDDPGFYDLVARLLYWTWDNRDLESVQAYAEEAGIGDFSCVALPQGLASAGFFANIALLEFDQALREEFSRDIGENIRLIDVCRYVDDFRIVVSAASDYKLKEIEESVADWLQRLLDRHAPGLLVSKDQDKTRAAELAGEETPLVRQSERMSRIQGAVSGGFDAVAGSEILEAVQALVRTQRHLAATRDAADTWPFSPVPDVRDETVERFAAHRFRTTYRSLRPLLLPTPQPSDVEAKAYGWESRTRESLDLEAQAYALQLIQLWVENPSNIRLLRIGLDIWPSAAVLRDVLNLLRPLITSEHRDSVEYFVACFCLGEILRAGATETGQVDDPHALPLEPLVSEYRDVLKNEAERIVARVEDGLPWYLRQQAYLFLAQARDVATPANRPREDPESRHYLELLDFLDGLPVSVDASSLATYAIIARRALLDGPLSSQLVGHYLSAKVFAAIAERDPSFANELLQAYPDASQLVSARIRDDLSLARDEAAAGEVTLAAAILDSPRDNPLRSEYELLKLAVGILLELREPEWASREAAIVPRNVLIMLDEAGRLKIDGNRPSVRLRRSRANPAFSPYLPPDWCSETDVWRFQVGYLLRFVLAADADFTKSQALIPRKEKPGIYRAPGSHWYQRLYGLFNAQAGFGDDWLPISDWIERLLLELLHWPGCRRPPPESRICGTLEETIDRIRQRMIEIARWQYGTSSPFILKLQAPQPGEKAVERPFRACIVQTVLPRWPEHFDIKDPEFNRPGVRNLHRNHLSAALAAVRRMLVLRRTHKPEASQLDLLVLPELAVHPQDIQTHLVPFARAHKTMILAGLTYERVLPNQPLVNSAIWIIPTWSKANGLQVQVLRQGKYHLAHPELEWNTGPGGNLLMSFRPCQWIIGYQWSRNHEDPRLWLTASICYDATDLALAASLRHQSDVFLIPALNKDVATFDNMALALHYHMFQHVVVVNNGDFGGSNAYAPYRLEFERQIFHLHGQPQASLAFFEIDPVAEYLGRWEAAKEQARDNVDSRRSKSWKYPPAGRYE